MGDRGNVAIIQNRSRTQQVWVYTHWSGYDLPKLVQDGIKAAEPRWNDYSYATKIIIGRIIPTGNWHDETGFGIGWVDGQIPNGFNPLRHTKQWTFEQFLELRGEELEGAR